MTGSGAGSRLATSWRSGPLGVPAFRLLTAGQFASNIGNYCYAVALPWFVLSGHGSTILLGILLACYGIPGVALIPVGGILADKIGQRTTMLAADLSRCASVAVFAVLAAHHVVSIAALGPLAALIGAGEGMFVPASFSIMPVLLEKDKLLAGNAFYNVGQQTGSLIGPAIGGVLVAAAGPVPALAVDAASFGISALTLAVMRSHGGVPGEAAGSGAAGSEAGAGEPAGSVLAFLRSVPSMQVLLLIVIVSNLTSGGLSEVALPSLAHERWAADGYGALLTVLACGAIAGNLAAARAGRARRPMIVSTCAFVVMAVAMAAVPFVGGLPGAAGALLAMGLCQSFGNTLMMPPVQTVMPRPMLGRLMGVMMLCSSGTFPLSVAVTGVLVRHIGPAAFFPIAGAFFGVVMVFAMTQRGFREFGAREAVAAGQSAAL